MKSNISALKHGILTLGVCASLAVGILGFGGSVEARVPDGDRVSYTAAMCGLIQDSYDDAKAIADDIMRGVLERARARSQMEHDETAWKHEGCDDHYGSIAQRNAPGVILGGRVSTDRLPDMPVLGSANSGPVANAGAGVTAN
jgi:hypothetical protein